MKNDAGTLKPCTSGLLMGESVSLTGGQLGVSGEPKGRVNEFVDPRIRHRLHFMYKDKKYIQRDLGVVKINTK